MKKLTKKFYVASRSTIVNGEWTHATVEGAIAHAKKLMNDNNDDNEQYIVEVIRVVKRRHVPLIVEKV